jgi:nuclear transport factor 2 (NTF2) superfamily protein
MATESKPPLPPFTRETAQQKVKAAQAAWNTKCATIKHIITVSFADDLQKRGTRPIRLHP